MTNTKLSMPRKYEHISIEVLFYHYVLHVNC